MRDHVSQLREQRKLAARLYEKVKAMKDLCDPSVAYQLDPILNRAAELKDYFRKMADLLSRVDDDAVQLSLELGNLIEDETARTRHASSQAFML